MKYFFYSISLLALIFSTSLAGTIDPKTSDSKYVNYGSQFHCVLSICGIDNDGKLFCASAVAIKPNWIITAAHVVSQAKQCYITINDKVYPITSIKCHPNYHEDVFGEYDLAIGYTEKDIGLDFYPTLYSDRDEVGKVCSIAGFGITGTFHTGITTHDGKRRAGSNIIEEIQKKLLICKPSITNKTELEFIIGSGDSGGGLFIGNKLAGINSCVIAIDGKPDSTYYDEAGHTRISEYVEWINESVK